MRDVFRQDGSLKSDVCLQPPSPHAVELVSDLSHDGASPKERYERFYKPHKLQLRPLCKGSAVCRGLLEQTTGPQKNEIKFGKAEE